MISFAYTIYTFVCNVNKFNFSIIELRTIKCSLKVYYIGNQTSRLYVYIKISDLSIDMQFKFMDGFKIISFVHISNTNRVVTCTSKYILLLWKPNKFSNCLWLIDITLNHSLYFTIRSDRKKSYLILANSC